MTSDRWRLVQDLYHAASDMPPAERAVFIAQNCDGDENLRREVEELLQQSEAPGSILDHPAAQLLEQAELREGQALGPYRVLGRIGSGGMGAVYKAFDARLGRQVAIKILRAGSTGRFQREARAVAALNHPHICTLYDIGPNYLVMEYLEGAPIQGPMPLPQALKLAIAIAEGLHAAHRKGVIHRDLKPANILLTESGPKLLDFGLAKLAPGPGSDAPDSLTWAGTGPVTIAGTMQYMSPEQLQGRGADARSDIFSFGVVFFEILTGHPAFEADNSASLIAAILTAQPRLGKFLPHVPPEVERVLDRCLAKDPAARWQNAHDLKAALECISAAAAPPPAPPRRSRAAWALAAVMALTTAALAWLQWRPQLRWRPVMALTEPAASQVSQLAVFDRQGHKLGAVGAPADYSNPALSPDGARLAISVRDSTGKRDIWIFDLVQGGQARFTSDPTDETNPVWSPDGSEIVYCSDRSGRRDLYTRPTPNGPERLLLASDRNKNPMDWARDGSAIYYNNERPEGGYEIWMLPLAGKERTPRAFLNRPETRDWMGLSPDSRWVLYRSGSGASRKLWLRPLEFPSGEWQIGTTGTSEGHWRADGRQFYFMTGTTMMAQDMQGDGPQLRLGTPVRLFQVPQPNGFGRNTFVVTADGQRFLVRTGR